MRQLQRAQRDGTPNGLHRCYGCGEWKGICLDPSEVFAELVMTVHCRCDNNSRCARCGERVAERRLNATFYDPRDCQIWQVPGFEAIAIRCVR